MQSSWTRLASDGLLARYAAVCVQLLIVAMRLEQTFEESKVGSYPPIRALEWLECEGWRSEEEW
jgi:hypothetical protein